MARREELVRCLISSGHLHPETLGNLRLAHGAFRQLVALEISGLSCVLPLPPLSECTPECLAVTRGRDLPVLTGCVIVLLHSFWTVSGE